MKNVLLIILLLFLLSCTTNSPQNKLDKGPWLFELQISSEDPELTIPFNVEVLNSNQLIILNATERIEVNEIIYKEDSVIIKIPVFGSVFRGKLSNGKISGRYFNYNKNKLLSIPFVAVSGVSNRFEIVDTSAYDFTGQWQAIFGTGEEVSPAIGIFDQKANIVTGTFMTETGDYRYLQGVVNGNTIRLSCFDGAHAFLFTAIQINDSLKGWFYSGNTWKQSWTATRTDDPVLNDMKSLTFLRPGYKKLSFLFPNVNGKSISLDDEKYRDKVVIVQIFGTWCPNCMDETRYLVELHQKYNSKGLEIIGLDFEPKTEFAYFKERITLYKNDLNVSYEMLLAGPSNKMLAAKALPMLNKIISYPTAIFIDRAGNIREIHTGFSGPGTGKHYERYRSETKKLLEELLDE